MPLILPAQAVNTPVGIYQCKTKDSSLVAEFQFQNGSPIEATMTFKNDFHDSTMMLQFMEDYNEVAGKSLYVQVAMLMNSILFDVKFVPNSTTDMTGYADVFGDGPMKMNPVSCTYSVHE